jgi:hypothetical protein
MRRIFSCLFLVFFTCGQAASSGLAGVSLTLSPVRSISQEQTIFVVEALAGRVGSIVERQPHEFASHFFKLANLWRSIPVASATSFSFPALPTEPLRRSFIVGSVALLPGAARLMAWRRASARVSFPTPAQSLVHLRASLKQKLTFVGPVDFAAGEMKAIFDGIQEFVVKDRAWRQFDAPSEVVGPDYEERQKKRMSDLQQAAWKILAKDKAIKDRALKKIFRQAYTPERLENFLFDQLPAIAAQRGLYVRFEQYRRMPTRTRGDIYCSPLIPSNAGTAPPRSPFPGRAGLYSPRRSRKDFFIRRPAHSWSNSAMEFRFVLCCNSIFNRIFY